MAGEIAGCESPTIGPIVGHSPDRCHVHRDRHTPDSAADEAFIRNNVLGIQPFWQRYPTRFVRLPGQRYLPPAETAASGEFLKLQQRFARIGALYPVVYIASRVWRVFEAATTVRNLQEGNP